MWFFNPIARFRRRLNRRLRAAYLVEEDLILQRELQKNLKLAQASVALAKDDEAIYARLIGHQPPDALTQILHEELLVWMRIRDALRSLAERDLIPTVYRQEVDQLRPSVTDLYELAARARQELNRIANPPQPRRLPIVTIKGKKYFRDDRLREFRAVDNPHDRIPY